jgi:hypothetical protein
VWYGFLPHRVNQKKLFVMWQKNYLIAFVATALLAVITMFSCKKESPGIENPKEGKTELTMRLTDDPSEYDAVFIDIKSVEIDMEGKSTVTLVPLRPGIYDLMKFRNGIDTLLIKSDVEPGKINQIRLLLGSNNSVVVDGQSYPLNTPSAQESGLKLNLNEELVANTPYTMWLDFDAGKSIVKTGNGKYNLKPVVRAYAVATDGRIEGYVLPGIALATVYASNGTETYAAIPNENGYYMFTGLPAGTYSVTFDAGLITYTDVTMNNVQVKYGSVTNLGTVILEP